MSLHFGQVPKVSVQTSERRVIAVLRTCRRQLPNCRWQHTPSVANWKCYLSHTKVVSSQPALLCFCPSLPPVRLDSPYERHTHAHRERQGRFLFATPELRRNSCACRLPKLARACPTSSSPSLSSASASSTTSRCMPRRRAMAMALERPGMPHSSRYVGASATSSNSTHAFSKRGSEYLSV
eukprot:6201341-Pleurochrysis_carterae.AAC.3